MESGSQAVKYSSFSTETGATEFYISIVPQHSKSFEDALIEICNLYEAFLQKHKLSLSTQQFMRLYFSDITNEFNLFNNSTLKKFTDRGAVSFIQQSPVGTGISLLAYHVTNLLIVTDNNFPDNHLLNYNKTVLTKGRYYSLLWAVNQTENSCKSSEEQTDQILRSLAETLKAGNMNLRDNMVRTWIYVRDVDNNYQGMVKERKRYFENIGLTDKTRYIASTGIEGKTVVPQSLVSFDTLSIGNIRESQLVRMEAPENMSSTIVYGVTFERGMRLRFGDRSHLYISGTASIDKEGKILFENDIRKQTHRTIDNIEALLSNQGASISDMKYLLIYFRNYKHCTLIQDILESRLPKDIPILMLEGAVCRPGWLIEMEGTGIIRDESEFPPFF